MKNILNSGVSMLATLATFTTQSIGAVLIMSQWDYKDIGKHAFKCMKKPEEEVQEEKTQPRKAKVQQLQTMKLRM